MNSIIDSITCNIKQLPMTDPFTGSDGQTYEKSAIINWLQRNATSPTDREPMNIESLKLNVAIKFLCDKYHNGEFNNINIPTDNTSNNNEPIISEKKIDIYTHLKKNNAQNLLNFSFNCQNIDNVNVFPEIHPVYLNPEMYLPPMLAKPVSKHCATQPKKPFR